ESDNQVRELVVRQGDHLTLYSMRDFLGSDPNAAPADPATQVASAPSVPKNSVAEKDANKKDRAPTTYELLIEGDVRADQYRGEQRVAGMRADKIRLVIDSGHGGQNALTRRNAEASAPAGVPNENAASNAEVAAPPEQTGKLVLTWTGPLRLNPLGETRSASQPMRRHFEATGSPVVLEQRDGGVECGRVEYHEETKQVWLYPTREGRVRFQRDARASASADSVYIDQKNNIVKLIGNVLLNSYGNNGRNAVAIRADLWGELLLRDRDAELPAEPAVQAAPDVMSATDQANVNFGDLRAARFVGSVHVEFGKDRLDAGQLDVAFRHDDAAPKLNGTLERVIASSGVLFKNGPRALRCDRLLLDFAVTEAGDMFPAETNASGDVLMRQGRATVRGRNVHVEFDPPPPGAVGGSNDPRVRALQIVDQAKLVNPDSRVAARGDKIIARFEGDNVLRDADVIGTLDHFAEVRADNYRVRGQKIEMNPSEQRLRVDGRAWLAFDAQQLTRAPGNRPVLVQIDSHQYLNVDAKNDKIEFAGNVSARSGDEKLDSDRLTLLLRSEERERTAPKRRLAVFFPFSAFLATSGNGLAAEDSETSNAIGIADRAQRAYRSVAVAMGLSPRGVDSPRVPLGIAPNDEAFRKMPVRLVADNSIFLSEPKSPLGKILSTAEVVSTKLNFDIENRQIVSLGETFLGMTTYTLEEKAAEMQAGGASSSPLVARGPSQSALICNKQMTYAIGSDSAGARRDAVVFDGDVRLIHRTGREIKSIEEMIPDLRADQLEKLPSRSTSLDCERVECEFVANASETRGPRSGMELAWMICNGEVYLRDKQEDTIRTVYCDRLEFNRENSTITANGNLPDSVRILIENPTTNEFSQPVIGQYFTIDLTNNQVRTDQTRGEFRR
ncbi:MAG: hypothetical protein AB7N71_11840, partial [Phycisphaerae bacterium]